MAGRYTAPPPPDFARAPAFRSEPARKPKSNPLEDFLRIGSAAAPAVGAVGGGIIGTMLGPGVGTAAGAGLGMAAGAGAGALMTGGADMMSRPGENAEAERVARENERAARLQAAMGLL